DANQNIQWYVTCHRRLRWTLCPTAPTRSSTRPWRSLHADACRDHAAVAWVVLWDLPAYPERYAAGLATSGSPPAPYLLLADTLAGIRAMLPPGMKQSERMPADLPEVV